MATISNSSRHIISRNAWVFSWRISARPYSSFNSFPSLDSSRCHDSVRLCGRYESTRSMAGGKVPLVTLSSGYKMPIVGLGTWQLDDEETLRVSLEAALDAGYRHIDAAFAYKNEKALGNVLAALFREGKIKREELFITSKLPQNAMCTEDVNLFFEKSRTALQLDYLDLYLLHFPLPTRRNEDNDFEFVIVKDGDAIVEDVDIVETYVMVELLVTSRRARSIGLSNFNSEQVERIRCNTSIHPAVLQVECHAYLPQYELLEYCKSKNIVMTAYAPLGSPSLPDFVKKEKGMDFTPPVLLKEEKLKPLAKKHNKSEAQILLKYNVQRGIVVIPKSKDPKEIKENIELFDFTLDEEDMKVLSSMANGFRYFPMTEWPSFRSHPEFPFGIPF